jgi:Flp pilus assembly pilin Flp
MVKRFLRDELGQDLIEYTLLMAFIALASAALIGNLGMSVANMWNKGNSVLSNAVTSAS